MWVHEWLLWLQDKLKEKPSALSLSCTFFGFLSTVYIKGEKVLTSKINWNEKMKVDYLFAEKRALLVTKTTFIELIRLFASEIFIISYQLSYLDVTNGTHY